MGDESQLCDNELMVVLALIKAICRVEFPHYPPFTPSYTSETGLSESQPAPAPCKSCTMLQNPDVSIKTSYGPFKKGTHHRDHCKTPLQHMDSSKSSSGGVILLSCCDGSQVNYHRGVWARRNLTLKHAFRGAGGMPRVAWLLWVNQWEAERLWFYKMMDRAEGRKSHF